MKKRPIKQLSMEKFLRNKLDLSLWIVAIVLLIMTLAYSVLVVRFLARVVKNVMNPNLIKNQEVVTFSISKAREIRERERNR